MTRKRRFLALQTSLAFALFVAGAAHAAGSAAGVVWVAATEKGAVDVFWLPTGVRWPAGGWRLERLIGDKGTVVAPALKPTGDTGALSALGDQEVNAIRMFADQLGKGALSGDQLQAAEIVVGLSAATNLDFGRALGVRYTDAQPGSAPCRYRVTGLDGSGKALGSFTSREIDPTSATPPPPPPSALEASISRDGVGLTWGDAPRDTDPPVVGYTIERLDANGKVALRTPHPVVVGAKRVAGKPLYLDRYAPGEAEVTYRVQSVNAFAQVSQWIDLKYFVKDLAALDPPKDLRAVGGINSAKLLWSPATNPHTEGFVVSRSTLQGGPYTVITAQALPATIGSYSDMNLRGGAPYFYRIQAIGPRDEIGPPSDPAMALPTNASPPPQVTGVKVDVGTTRMQLRWDPVPFQVAGYFVQRQAPGAGDWVTLNSRVTPETRFDDYVGPSPGGTLRYRVVAVAFDNQVSPPSAVVEATLPDTVPPNPPRITSADGSGGKVELTFVAAPPAADTAQIVVVRASSPTDPGIVVGDPLPGSASSFEDALATPGQSVFYRLVAVDAAGNRSEPSRAVAVRVGSPDLPQPEAPAVKLVSEPFPRVVITCAAPPPGLSVVVQRQGEGEAGWFFVAGPTTATEVSDVHPPLKGKIAYRIVYQAANGVQGPPSPPTEISR
jgi:hypothetical protein